MSTVTNDLTATRQDFSSLRRVWNVTRLQATDKWQSIAVPWMVMGVILLFNLVLFWLLMSTLQPEDQPTSNTYNGGSYFLFVYMLVIAIQAMNRTFPFALGFGVTRRDYYLGTSLAFVIYSVWFGAALTVLSLVEKWTHGWGVGLALFRTQFLRDDNLGQTLFVNIAGFIVFFLIGMVFGTVFVRWRANGLVALGVIIALLAIGSIAFATLTKSWSHVGEWFVSSGITGVTAWLLLFSALFGVVGFFILRKATPRN